MEQLEVLKKVLNDKQLCEAIKVILNQPKKHLIDTDEGCFSVQLTADAIKEAAQSCTEEQVKA